ncbi:O-antigen ligase family protein [Acuticoccus kandeliae]|uniref:O-antigen ligase family protein n=1 Tax=Acuticoccus kandeliae TaxID=2073160 RepID=UPI000D3E2C89|nr:O-antigen ligase [Acuticoccus kandeliae]
MIRIPKRIVTEAPANTLYIAAAMTVSMFVFAYSTRFGQISILALYGVWFLPLAVEPRLLLKHFGVTVLLFAIAALAIASTVWSMNPSGSLRAGIQYATTIVCAIVAARICGRTGFLLGGLVGSLLVGLYSLAIGGYHYDVIDASYAFTGAFASKNQLGFFASLAILFSIAALFERSWLIRLFAAFILLFGAFLLVSSDSATSLITVAGAAMMMVAIIIAGRAHPTVRFVLVGLAALGVALLALIAIQFGALEGVLGAFGKDSTLTGRTYLWSQGIAAVGERPLFGMGYTAFWTVGYTPAEDLWREFYITARTGFHFHNTYIETAVGLGLVGLFLLFTMLMWAIALAAGTIMRARTSVFDALTITFAVLLLMRSFVEIDFLMPYTIGSFLLYFAMMRLVEERYRARTMARERLAAARPSDRLLGRSLPA